MGALITLFLWVIIFAYYACGFGFIFYYLNITITEQGHLETPQIFYIIIFISILILMLIIAFFLSKKLEDLFFGELVKIFMVISFIIFYLVILFAGLIMDDIEDSIKFLFLKDNTQSLLSNIIMIIFQYCMLTTIPTFLSAIEVKIISKIREYKKYKIEKK